MQNQYQRRADLIPNLVATVQGYAAQEKSVLTGVVEGLAHYRDAAGKLVRSPFGQARIPVITDALLRHGSLTGEQIAGLVG